MRLSHFANLLKLAGVFCAVLLPALARAQVSVNATVNFNAGTSLYTYNYSVVNATPIDLAIVTLTVVADPTAVQSVTTPAGYQSNVDLVNGFVDFLPDLGVTGFAPGTTTSGFTLVSPFAPNGEQFLAFDSQFNPFVGNTFAPVAVPEPGVVALGMTALASGLGLGLRASRRTKMRRSA